MWLEDKQTSLKTMRRAVMAAQDLVKIVEMGSEEYIFYPAPKHLGWSDGGAAKSKNKPYV